MVHKFDKIVQINKHLEKKLQYPETSSYKETLQLFLLHFR